MGAPVDLRGQVVGVGGGEVDPGGDASDDLDGDVVAVPSPDFMANATPRAMRGSLRKWKRPSQSDCEGRSTV